MLLLGHMCWAYVTGRCCASALKVNVNPYLILVLGAVPDFDLLLGSFGIVHRGITHSVLFWSIVFIPLFIRYRKQAVPYFVAPISHILIGDLVVNRTTVFWPLGPELGLRYRLFSIENLILEAVALAAFLIWVNLSTERSKLFARNRRNLLSILPIIPLAGFLMFLYQADLPMQIQFEGESDQMEKIAERVMRKSLFPFVLSMHLVLLAFLSICFIQGSRALIKKPIHHSQ
ncbi:MAG: metal-dependent hydrolase [Nitrososphaerales archaeon]